MIFKAENLRYSDITIAFQYIEANTRIVERIENACLYRVAMEWEGMGHCTALYAFRILFF